jgi:hypothetical protein
MLCGKNTCIFLKVFLNFDDKCIYVLHRGQCKNKGMGM